VITGDRLLNVESTTAVPLVARIRVGETVTLWVSPVTTRGCDASYANGSWASTDPSVADVVPLDQSGRSARLTGRRPGDTVVSGEVVYAPLAGMPTRHQAQLMYYCCGSSCPISPPACAHVPIERLRVVAD
jgi:hypothetical protein